MQFDAPIDPARLILAFGLCLFLALVCMLKWQHRRHFSKMRVTRGLRVYVSNQNQQQAA